MSSRVPSSEEEQESTRVRTARLRRDVRRFHKSHDDHPSSEDPLVKIYLEGRKWFMEQQVGPFLDKIKNLAREPEWARLQPNQCTRLYISNIRTRTKTDIPSKLKQLGVNIRQDDRAKFEVKYSKNLRLETAVLSVLVEPNSQFLDLLTGTRRVDGIMGPVSFTILEDDTETILQA